MDFLIRLLAAIVVGGLVGWGVGLLGAPSPLPGLAGVVAGLIVFFTWEGLTGPRLRR